MSSMGLDRVGPGLVGAGRADRLKPGASKTVPTRRPLSGDALGLLEQKKMSSSDISKPQ